jgi:hypothetical protein
MNCIDGQCAGYDEGDGDPGMLHSHRLLSSFEAPRQAKR